MLSVIKGGLDPSNNSRYEFISAEVTDTRLMGVIAMHLSWRDLFCDSPNLHQFFYFDYEELGLESLRILYSNDDESISIAQKESFAGLGAKEVSLTEREARYLACFMFKDTKQKKQELPAEVKEITYITENEPQLSELEIKNLNLKICVPIKTDYGVVNYYLMRCFGKDYEAAKLLLEDDSKLMDISPSCHSTFLRNKIESLSESCGSIKSYRAESLLELDKDGSHLLIVSQIDIHNRKVISAHKISEMKISVLEASMILNKKEFVDLYQITCTPELFAACFTEFSLGMTHTSHECGEMFMLFKDNNNHAESKCFYLSDDLEALFFVTDTGEMIVTAYSANGIIDIETRLLMSPVGDLIEAKARYQFPNSIIYDFAESGISSFQEFLSKI